MSLYYEAISLLTNEEKRGGSLKSRVYGSKDVKNPPAKLYALLVESLKWSLFLKQVIERSEILKLEKKVCLT
jgi:putative methyltransferase